MKKLFLIPIFFALILTSCSDDDSETFEPPVSEIDAKMRGDWTNTLIKRVYYSINDEVMYTDSVQYQTTFSFDGKRMTVTVPGSTKPEVMSYRFPDPKDSTKIEIQQGSVTGQYTVKSVTDSEMAWIEEKQWAGYPEEAPESEKTTSKVGVYTWKFIRKR
ncbi:hypothetical protein H9Q13_00450 [Pontibacter sp. JH31]|uniref:Lipocalin-like domain-containing protein n=1 Tax=Pontibacter aquaedesilientis TaxID=2766980 RepID=A0ABR7XE23_9BACT|nr:hypothetical protein [Pontibacter aquaedesilientis]MBD1395621.1 hypothetical protein [Pontibacter aquaedesilientis]